MLLWFVKCSHVRVMSVCVTMQLRCGLKIQEIKYNYIINVCEFTLHFVYQYLKYSLEIHEEKQNKLIQMEI